MLLLLFAVYQTNIIVNAHMHYINGIVFTHSHPNNGDHTHSNAETLLLNRLSVFHSLKATYNAYHSFQQSVFCIIESKQNTLHITNTCRNALTLRAPPVFYFI